MKIKANINGKMYTRVVHTFTASQGTNFHYIVINNTPYIVLMRNGHPDGLITIDTFMNSIQPREEVPA